MEIWMYGLSLAVMSGTVLCAAGAVGTTRVARWKHGKACVFMLMFDDGLNSQLAYALPQLQKRGLTGSFYPNPGSGHCRANRETWETVLPREGFELGNHTFTHRGGTSRAAVVEEITASNEFIRHSTPDLPWPRLVSYAEPGGLQKERWPLTREESDQIMADHHLIRRPGFSGRGAGIAFTTGEEILAHVDRAMNAEKMECVIFHGVVGDWISFPLQEFILFLDGLKEREDSVWVASRWTDHVLCEAPDWLVIPYRDQRLQPLCDRLGS